jgi:hypothetical protein
MLPLKRSYAVFCLLAACAIRPAAASPQTSTLLALVPEGARIVAGIEDPHNPNSHGRLLLVTHSDSLDYQDWISLTGVDPSRRVDEVIEVAAPSQRGELTGHLLLLSGRFDQERIYKEAELHGTRSSEFHGVEILSVDPFAREQQEMRDTRSLAILNDQITIFGTPDLVQRALDRYQAHEAVDATLEARIERLRSDINSWDILAMPAAMLARHLRLGNLQDPWSEAVAGTDELILGIHYGSTARVDFAIHSANDRQIDAIAAMLEQPRLVKASATRKWRPRVEALFVDGSRLEGSVTVSGKRFDAFLEAICWSRVSKSSDH